MTREEQPRTEEAISRGMDNLRKSSKFYFMAADKFPEVSDWIVVLHMKLDRMLTERRTTKDMSGISRYGIDNTPVPCYIADSSRVDRPRPTIHRWRPTLHHHAHRRESATKATRRLGDLAVL